MKSRSILAAIAAAALALVLVPATANAQDTTDVFVVHGLNLAGQTAPGGTSVTVCADDTELIGDFTFGTITDAVPLTSGVAVNIEVFGGVNTPCTDSGALIDDDVTPTGAAVALVATSAGGTPALTAFELNAACTDAGEGRLTALHASGDTGAVDVLVNGDTVDALTFGESLEADLPAATYSVQVNLGGSPVVGPADIPVAAQANTMVFVVGNITSAGPSPVVPLIADFAVDTCQTPVTPTPTTPTVVPPTPGVAPAAAPAPISFTG